MEVDTLPFVVASVRTWCCYTPTVTTRNTERGVSDNGPCDEELCKCESHALPAPVAQAQVSEVEGSHARPEGEERWRGGPPRRP